MVKACLAFQPISRVTKMNNLEQILSSKRRALENEEINSATFTVR